MGASLVREATTSHSHTRVPQKQLSHWGRAAGLQHKKVPSKQRENNRTWPCSPVCGAAERGRAMSRLEFKSVKQHHRCSVVSHGYGGEEGDPGSHRLGFSSFHIEAGSPEVATQLSSFLGLPTLQDLGAFTWLT